MCVCVYAEALLPHLAHIHVFCILCKDHIWLVTYDRRTNQTLHIKTLVIGFAGVLKHKVNEWYKRPLDSLKWRIKYCKRDTYDVLKTFTTYRVTNMLLMCFFWPTIIQIKALECSATVASQWIFHGFWSVNVCVVLSWHLELLVNHPYRAALVCESVFDRATCYIHSWNAEELVSPDSL